MAEVAHSPTDDSQLVHQPGSPGEPANGSEASSNTKAAAPQEYENVSSGNEKAVAPNDDGDDRIELTEDDCYEELGFCFPTWKKWTILTLIFLVQVSMNFNTSLYSNGLKGISKEFGVSAQAARCGAMIFLITYAFGCELWAPW